MNKYIINNTWSSTFHFVFKMLRFDWPANETMLVTQGCDVLGIYQHKNLHLNSSCNTKPQMPRKSESFPSYHTKARNSSATFKCPAQFWWKFALLVIKKSTQKDMLIFYIFNKSQYLKNGDTEWKSSMWYPLSLQDNFQIK